MSETLHLFEAFGIELEYMIVDRETLAVRPISAVLLHDDAGEVQSEIEHGEVSWSNELVAHVVELKTNGPRPSLAGLADAFQRDIERITELLEPHGAQLMPGGMHPTMNPFTDTKLWPYEYGIVYETFDRIFDCKGHGWANLQSMHINLPFSGDDEFGRLHAAIRLALPILPALCASSPFMDGQRGPGLDSRLEVCRSNARRVPSVSGVVVPERVFTREAYEQELLGRIYSDLAELDPDGVLRHEWINARGAIARFDRNAIEIRVLDITECPRSDIAIAEVIVGLVRALVEERFASRPDQERWDERSLAAILETVTRDAEATSIQNLDYLRALGRQGGAECTAGQLWSHILERLEGLELVSVEAATTVGQILAQGSLARRLVRRVEAASQSKGSPASLAPALDVVYRELCRSLAQGKLFAIDP